MHKKKNRETDVELRFLEALAVRSPDDIRILQALAELYTQTGRFKEGLEADLRLSRLSPLDGAVWYNLACSHALTGSADDAFAALEKAVRLGYDEYEWMQEDGDLESLRSDPRFKAILSRMKTPARP
ncbi:MAG: hypothetical protein AB7T27_00030 [Kiritimatiellia bacterium]